MKPRIATLSLLVVCLAALPALAGEKQIIYDNGAINGTTDAWTINFGFAVSNSFVVPQESLMTDFHFGAWVFPGDVLLSAELLVGTSEFGNDYADLVISFTQSGCTGNQYGFNVCTESADFQDTPITLAADTQYWVTLQNAVVNTGDPIYWDENSGPSSASENSVGTIPSEAFTITGLIESTTTSQTGTVPEPSSIMLFGSGTLGLAGVLRRKLF